MLVDGLGTGHTLRCKNPTWICSATRFFLPCSDLGKGSSKVGAYCPVFFWPLLCYSENTEVVNVMAQSLPTYRRV